MDDAPRCEQCAVPLTGQAVGGLCANCLLKLALEPPGELTAPSSGAADEPAEAAAAPGETVGSRIGNYTLLQQIGQGGFGTVWMAEQSEPVQRRVALKIVRIGMDTREFIARFEQERQALAMMDHPNIAKVFDAGATENGRPFFVMELVPGVPVTKFCDENKLTLTARLELFIEVCRAIQHAHQKGIIHRDIKPSNVMVSGDGLEPSSGPSAVENRRHVKVIDFGIAKATQGKLTDETVVTRFEQFIGTPVYMSPEQAGMVPDIDTRSDIYALGVLLYELLTGKPPFDAKSLVSAGYEEMRRIIREVEPPKPSTRLKELLTASTDKTPRQNSEPSGARQPADGSPKEIGGSREQFRIQKSKIESDLDWIVMKAIDKDRTRRYETVNGLALDLQRFLANEPVSATPPSAAYKFRKFARRNKAALSMGAGTAAALIAATIVSSWQAVRATNAEKLATDAGDLAKRRLVQVSAERDQKDKALEDAKEISTFLGEVFQSPDPSRDGREIKVADLLDKAVKKLETNLASQPGQRARLQATLGRTYHALGLYGDAIRLLEKVRDYYHTNAGPEDPATIGAMRDLALSYDEAGHLSKALNLQEELLALSRKIDGPEAQSTLNAINNLAICYHTAGRRDEALTMREDLLPLRRKVDGPEHQYTLNAMHNLAISYHDIGRREDALKLREEVLRLRHKVLAPEHPDTLKAMSNLARSYRDANRLDEALSLREELLPLSRRVFGPEHPDTLITMSNLASSLAAAGRHAEALKLEEEVMPLYRKALVPGHRNALDAMFNLARTLDRAGRPAEALSLREELVPLCRKVLDPGHRRRLEAMQDLAQSYDDAGRKGEAQALRRELADREVPSPPAPAPTPPTETKIDVQKTPRLPDTAVAAILVTSESEWKWLHPTDGKDPAETVPDFQASFFLPDFDDSKWNTGQDSDVPDGGFGYGLSFDGVNIGKPETMENRRTAYFRHTFKTAKAHANLQLSCRRDDGIIVYLDGKEILRDNMETGPDAYHLAAKATVGTGEDIVVHRFPIPGTLAAGTHTLAISVHNTAQASADLRLGGVRLVEVKPAAKEK